MSYLFLAKRWVIYLIFCSLILSIPSFTFAYATSLKEDGLVAYWSFDELNGDAVDNSGNGHTLHNLNSVSYSEGKVGNAATFLKNLHQVLIIPSAEASAFGFTKFSFSAWVKSTPDFSTQDKRPIICKFTPFTSGYCEGFGTETSKIPNLYRVLGASGEHEQGRESFEAPADNEWHHVVFTYDGGPAHTSVEKWYIDGVLVVTDTGQLTISADTSADFVVGGLWQGTTVSNRFWDGKIDELGIWNRVLTPEEIAALYNGGDGLAYPFDAPACTQKCYSNVLFIPGMESSRLYEQNVFTGEDQLWEPGNLQIDAKRLYLNEDGTSINSVYTKPDGAIDSVFGFGDVYRTFLEQLANNKANGTYNDYAVFPYDWRMSPSSVIEDGTPYNDGTQHYLEPLVESLAASSKSGKVTIVAHSNGGLVTKALMEKLQSEGKESLVDKIIFVDVPHSGTPKAIASLLHGDFQNIGWGDIGFIVSKANARGLGENMPDGFSLLPSLAYFGAVISPIVDLSHAPSLRSLSGVLGAMLTSASELRTFMTEVGGRSKPSYSETDTPNVLSSTLFDQAATEHAALDTWEAPPNIEVYQVAGWGLDTPIGIAYDESKEKFCLTVGVCTLRTVLSHDHVMSVDGDGTVALPSEVMSSSWPTYYLNLSALNRVASKTFNHANITESAPFQQLFSELITTGAPSVLPPYVTTNAPTPAPTDRRLRIRLRPPSPAYAGGSIVSLIRQSSGESELGMSLDAYDSAGRHTGRAPNPKPGSDLDFVEQQIPGSYYDESGQNPYIGLSNNDEYHTVLTGHAFGTFTLSIVPVVAGEEQSPIVFEDVPSTPETVATVDVLVNTPQTASLRLDLDGDGTVDKIIGASETATRDPLAYLDLIFASVDTMNLNRPAYSQFTAEFTNIRYMIRALSSTNTKALLPQIVRKLTALETLVEKANDTQTITPEQATLLLQIVGHLKDLLVV